MYRVSSHRVQLGIPFFSCWAGVGMEGGVVPRETLCPFRHLILLLLGGCGKGGRGVGMEGRDVRLRGSAVVALETVFPCTLYK